MRSASKRMFVLPLGLRLPAVPLLVPILAALSLAASTSAQRGARTRRASEHSKDHGSIRAAFRDCVAPVRGGTVRLLSNGNAVALGVVVGPGGLVLTKASELGTDLTCEDGEGGSLRATILATDRDTDLALLRVAAGPVLEAWTPVRWVVDAAPEPGSFVAVAGPETTPIAVGVVSVAPRARVERVRRRPVLEVDFDDDWSCARVRRVRADSAAARAGLLAGDVIDRVDDWEVHSARSFARAIGRMGSKSRVALRVLRGNSVLTIDAPVEHGVDRRGERNRQESFWGPLSDVRAGFEDVLQHDSVLRPADCGGPLVDLDGQVIGLNIARTGRVETLALPSGAVVEALARLRAKAGLDRQEDNKQEHDEERAPSAGDASRGSAETRRDAP